MAFTVMVLAGTANRKVALSSGETRDDMLNERFECGEARTDDSKVQLDYTGTGLSVHKR